MGLLNLKKEKPIDNPIDHIIDMVCDLGLTPPNPDSIRIGKTSWLGAGGDRNKPSSYILLNEGDDGGFFGEIGDWREDIKRPFSFKCSDTSFEMKIVDRSAEASKASDQAKYVWKTSSDCRHHPYLEAKGINPHGVRLSVKGDLVIPIRGQDGKLVAVQFIKPEPDENGKYRKNFMKGSNINGGAFIFGKPEKGEPILVAEGYADGASLFEATENCTVAAFSAGNLPNIAERLKKVSATNEIWFVADADDKGRKYANEAASKLENSKVIEIPYEGMDPNDVYQKYGKERLIDILLGKQIIEPEKDQVKPPKLLTVADIIAKGETFNWIVDGWIQENAIGFLYGPSGAGKTVIGFDLGAKIASGIKKYGTADVTTDRRKVLYLLAEPTDILQRAHLLNDHYNVGDNFVIPDVETTGIGSLASDEGIASIESILDSMTEKPVITFLDTLAMFAEGDTNDGAIAARIMKNLRVLVEKYKTTFCIVHHTGYGKESQHRMMGSQVYAGNSDFLIGMMPFKTIEETKKKESAFQAGIERVNNYGSIISMKAKGSRFYKAMDYKIESIELEHLFKSNGKNDTAATAVLSEQKSEDHSEPAKKRVKGEKVKTAEQLEQVFIDVFKENGYPIVTIHDKQYPAVSLYDLKLKLCQDGGYKWTDAFEKMFMPSKDSGPVKKMEAKGHSFISNASIGSETFEAFVANGDFKEQIEDTFKRELYEGKIKFKNKPKVSDGDDDNDINYEQLE